MPTALSRIITPAFPENDESLWFIRQLHVATDLNISFDTYDAARSLAVQTTRAIVNEMSAVDSSNIVRFGNRAQYLAAFLADLVEGTAWQHWYYRGFDGLTLLPLSAALRTAISKDADTGLSALHYLPPPVARKIVGQLADHDARRIFELMGDNTTEEEEAEFDIAIDALKHFAMQELGREKLSLVLLVEVTRSIGGRGKSTARMCEALAALVRCIRSISTAGRRQVLRAFENQDITLLSHAAGVTDANAISPLLHLSDSSRARILQSIREESAGTASTTDGSATVQTTPFGGAFFLLPMIDRLPLGQESLDLSLQHDEELIATLRWLLLVKCFGQAHASAAGRDPLIRVLTGVSPAVLAADVGRLCARQVRVWQLDRLLTGFLQYRLANQTIGREIGAFATAGSAKGEDTVLVDGMRGCWVLIVRSSKDDRALKSALREFPYLPELLLSRDEAVRQNGKSADLVEPLLASLEHLSEDVNYFSLPPEFGLPSHHDRVLSVVAQGLMRDFAWCLPGFAWSGPSYLRENFLDCEATLEQEGQRCVVTLGRAPLNLILNVAGINRRHYELSWSRGRRFELYPEPI